MRNSLPLVTKKILVVLVCVGILLRAYNLSWGSPFFFHPDERNIASSVSGLKYPEQLNPHFFAYGTLPIYSIYFTGVASNLVRNFLHISSAQPEVVLFEDAIIVSRIFSLFLSIIILQLVYAVGKKVGGTKAATISLVFSLFSVGLIQYAHFGTFEIWLTFFTLLLMYVLMRYQETSKNVYIIFGSIILGFLFSIKISSLIYLPLCFFLVLYYDVGKIIKKKKRNFLLIEKLILKLALILGIPFIVLFFTSPFYWFDNASFLNSMNYESGVALGKYVVFYTQSFAHSIPVLFQFLHIFPFLLNPFVAISVLIVSPFVIKNIWQDKNQKILLLMFFLLVSFFSQTFLFVKWTRYYIPTLPFIYIFLAKGLDFLAIFKKKRYSFYLTCILIFFSIFYSFVYFKVVLIDTDTRLQALSWARKNIGSEAKILTEPYDLGITPFNPYFSAVKIFDFYQLDDTKEKEKELKKELKLAQFIILPSQRIVQSRLMSPQLFPKSSQFYRKLFDDKRNFAKIYETPCDILCNILYIGNPVYTYEQTVNVFDRPTVYIFKKLGNN